MWPSIAHDEIAKVLVECDKDTPLIERVRQDRNVARVRRPVVYRLNIVSGTAQLPDDRRPD